MHQFWNHILCPILADLHPKKILHIGVGTGELTKVLVPYASHLGATVHTIDTVTRYDIAALVKCFPGVLTFSQGDVSKCTSALHSVDVVFIEGEPSWHAVTNSLQAIVKAVGSMERFPFTFVAHVGWPYARRDGYSHSSLTPASSKHPYSQAGMCPDQNLLVQGAGVFSEEMNARHQGGSHNGVLTAIEDFCTKYPTIHFQQISGFYGLGILHAGSVSPSLGRTLEHLSSDSTVTHHIQALEDARVRLLSSAADAKNVIAAAGIAVDSMHRDTEYKLEEYIRRKEWAEKLVEHYRIGIRQLEEDRAALMRSVSWQVLLCIRFCASCLRHPKKTIATIHWPYTFFAFLKKCWIACGTPAAWFVRGGRSMLGFIWPILPETGVIPRAIVKQAPLVAPQKKVEPKLVVPVSVIITSRNAMPYLRECLLSVLAQTVQPLEILYMDDGSTDGSVACAKEFSGVRVLQAEHRGVIAARNAAAEESAGDLLLFLDGDDILTPTFIEEHFQALQSSIEAGFSYGTISTFGAECGTYKAPIWSIAHLWLRNFVPTPSLLRRRVFFEAGGWRDTVGTLWDWDLFLRIAQKYCGVPCEARLLYRRHEKSWSAVHEGGLSITETHMLHGRLRRAAARISICTVYGGRLPGLLPLWAESIAQSVRSHPEKLHSPEILILDTSERGDEVLIRKAFERQKDIFSRITVVHRPGKISYGSETERRHKVCRLLAEAYTMLLTLSEGDIVWFIEDDIVVPLDAYRVLMNTLTDGAYDGHVTLPPDRPGSGIPAATSGLYKSRHSDEWIAYLVRGESPEQVTVRDPASLPIHLAGTGCLMVLKPLIPPRCAPYWAGSITAHDWAWSQAIRDAGYEILLEPTVRCRHHHTESSFV